MARTPHIGEKVDVLDFVKTHVLAVSAVSKRTTVGVSGGNPNGSVAFVTVISEVDGYLKRGDSTVVASVPADDSDSADHIFILAGLPQDVPVAPGQYLAFIAAENGTCRIMERQ